MHYSYSIRSTCFNDSPCIVLINVPTFIHFDTRIISQFCALNRIATDISFFLFFSFFFFIYLRWLYIKNRSTILSFNRRTFICYNGFFPFFSPFFFNNISSFNAQQRSKKRFKMNSEIHFILSALLNDEIFFKRVDIRSTSCLKYEW